MKKFMPKFSVKLFLKVIYEEYNYSLQVEYSGMSKAIKKYLIMSIVKREQLI